AFDPTVRCTPYDPADARKLVARSGFSNPTVHLLAVGADKAAQFIQAAEAAGGINVVMDPVDRATLQARELSGSFETASSGFSGSFNTDGNIFRFVASSGSRNY